MQKVKHNMNKSDFMRILATVGKGTAGLLISGVLMGGGPAALLADSFFGWMLFVVLVGAGIPAIMLAVDRTGASHLFEVGADLFDLYRDWGRRIYARIHFPHRTRGA